MLRHTPPPTKARSCRNAILILFVDKLAYSPLTHSCINLPNKMVVWLHTFCMAGKRCNGQQSQQARTARAGLYKQGY